MQEQKPKLVDDPDRMLKAALRYAAIGWAVFPLRSTGDTKRPHGMLGAKGGHTMATTDSDQIRAWWAQDRLANIGVWLAESGLIAIDIDPKDGGDKTMAALEALHGATRSPVTAITGRRNGGEHRVFATWDGMPSPPGELGRGIQLKYNGYIVVAPSVHPESGKRYAWRKGGSPFEAAWEMARLPGWCLVRSGPAGQLDAGRSTGVVDPDDVFAADAQRTDLSFAELRTKLMMVPNGGGDDGAEQTYEVWVQVGMALYHQTDGGEEGRALWEEWSEQSSRHNLEELNRKWRSLDASEKGRAPVTARYVLMLAKPYGEAIVAERLVGVKEGIQAASTFAALKAVCQRAKVLDLEPAIREALAGLVKTAFQRIEGSVLPIAECRRLLRQEHDVSSVAGVESLDEGDRAGKLPVWLDGVVYVEAEDRFYNHKTGSLLTAMAFDRAHGRTLLTDQERREGKTVPGVMPADVALNVWQVPSVDSRVYLPQEAQFFTMEGRRRVNMYSASGVVEAKPESEWTARERADVRRVDRHFSVLLPDERDSALLRSWCAYVVQTLRRVGFSALVQSVEGAGKTFLAEMMATLLGSRNVTTVSATEVESEFTAWAEGRLVVVVEEMRMRGHNRFDGLNRIKPFITNETIAVRRMRQDVVTVPNTASYMIFTNFRDALPIDDRDRRHMVLFSQFQTKDAIMAFMRQEPAYFDELFRAMRRSPGAVKGWLRGYGLHPDFKAGGRAPDTTHKKGMVELSKSDEQARVEEVLRESRDPLLSPSLIQFDNLVGALGAELQDIPHPKTLAHTLTDLGYTSLGRVRIGAERMRFWSAEPEKFTVDGVPNHLLIKQYVADNDL